VVSVKAYFDGSEIAARSLTLAAVAADDNTWARLEALWNEVKRERGNVSYIHMTDLMALQGIYREWSGEKRDYLVDGLLNVLLSFRGAERLHSFSCSIKLPDYKNVRRDRTLPEPERLCARMVFPHVMDWYGNLQGIDIGKIEFYFDRNEPFMRHVEPDWRSPAIRKRYPAWELVSSVTQADMKNTTPLQVTDVVAWGRNRLNAGSHWESDPHYATAVRACGSLYSIHRPVDKNGLLGFSYKEEGFAAIDPQRKAREIATGARNLRNSTV
jgi:hypothetical protein